MERSLRTFDTTLIHKQSYILLCLLITGFLALNLASTTIEYITLTLFLGIVAFFILHIELGR